jgi:hypothetical protein
MSQAYVEIVRRSVERFGPNLAGVDEFWHPDLDYRAIEGAPDDVGAIEGRDALRR